MWSFTSYLGSAQPPPSPCFRKISAITEFLSTGKKLQPEVHLSVLSTLLVIFLKSILSNIIIATPAFFEGGGSFHLQGIFFFNLLFFRVRVS